MSKLRKYIIKLTVFFSIYTLLQLDILIAIYFILLAIFLRIKSD